MVELNLTSKVQAVWLDKAALTGVRYIASLIRLVS